MRVAVLADIHGNLPALEAVLGEVDAAGADAIVLAGDMTVGPLQAETLDLLASLGERAIGVRGNCERTLVEVSGGASRPTGAAHEPGVIWSRASSSPASSATTWPPCRSPSASTSMGSARSCFAPPPPAPMG